MGDELKETGRLDLFNLTIMFRGLVLYMGGVPKGVPIKILLGYNMLMRERCNRDDKGEIIVDDDEHAAYEKSYEAVHRKQIPDEILKEVEHRIDVQDKIEKAAAKAAKKAKGGWFGRRLISCTRKGSPLLREVI